MALDRQLRRRGDLDREMRRFAISVDGMHNLAFDRKWRAWIVRDGADRFAVVREGVIGPVLVADHLLTLNAARVICQTAITQAQAREHNGRW